jgi:hypothetical protein
MRILARLKNEYDSKPEAWGEKDYWANGLSGPVADRFRSWSLRRQNAGGKMIMEVDQTDSEGKAK